MLKLVNTNDFTGGAVNAEFGSNEFKMTAKSIGVILEILAPKKPGLLSLNSLDMQNTSEITS